MDRYPIPHPAVLREILRHELPPAPATAMLHITEHCNVRCAFCWHHSFLKPDKHRPQKMETSAVIKMVQELAAMGTRDITVSANGEPTHHPGFPEIVDAAKESGMQLKVVTNLTLFTPAISAALAKTDHLIVNLAVTDDVDYQAVYAPLGQVSFSQVVENIRSLTRLRPRGPQIKIGHVLTKNTFRHIPRTLALAQDCGVDSIRFKLMDPLEFTQSLVLDGDDRAWLAGQLADLLKRQIPISHNLGDILQEISAPAVTGETAGDAHEHGRCFVGWLVMNINEDGTVTLCCQNDHLIIGNWKEKALREIWEGEKAQEFRHSAKTRIDFENPLWHACKTCHYSDPKHYAHRVNRGSGLSSRT